MSQMGHKQTFAPQNVMSALPPKADICGALAHVCFVPIADRGAELSCLLAGITRNAQPPGALDRQPLKQVSRSKSQLRLATGLLLLSDVQLGPQTNVHS